MKKKGKLYEKERNSIRKRIGKGEEKDSKRIRKGYGKDRKRIRKQ